MKTPLAWASALLALGLAACAEPAPVTLGAPELVQKTAPDAAGNAAASVGLLSLRNGCLGLEHPDRSMTLLLWPAEARLERTADGALRVLGTEGKAQHTVRVGEQILVGGGEIGDSAQVGPGRAVAANAAFAPGCTGPVWNVYSFEPAPAGLGGSTGAVDQAALKGEWVVAELGAARPAGGAETIEVTLTDSEVRARSGCVSFLWTYTLTASAFTTVREPGGPVCERTRSPWEKAFDEAMDRASAIHREQDGSVTISGPGGQVLLRRG